MSDTPGLRHFRVEIVDGAETHVTFLDSAFLSPDLCRRLAGFWLQLAEWGLIGESRDANAGCTISTSGFFSED